MGVKGLQYFMERHCTDVCQNVSIKELADDHKRLHPGSESVLVVDGMSLLNRLYCKKLEWIYGGQWVQFIDILKDFTNRFREISVSLVFYFDGSVAPSKRHEWVDRRLRKMRDVEAVFHWINLSGQEPPEENFLLPPAMGTFVRFALKWGVGVEVYSTIREADLEIAEYAKKNDAVFAILGQDSDFAIYDSKPYLSAEHLDLDYMTTICYDRRILAARLSLSVSKLPLFSCLLGNDIIPVEMVKPFHRQLCQSVGERRTVITVLGPLVSNLINSSGWRGDIYDLEELKAIANIALGDSRNYQLLREGLMMYSLATGSSPLSRDIMAKRHISCDNLPVMYNVLRSLVYESSELLEDPTDRSLPPAVKVYKPIRQRAYGILFAEAPGTVVNEWCAYFGNDLSRPDFVTPLPIRSTVRKCRLAELWSNSPDLHNYRLELFLGCLEIPLQPQHFCHLRNEDIVFCCILNYLVTYKPQLLELWEIVAFLVQAVSLKSKEVRDLYSLKVQRLDTRAVQLAGLFMRGVGTIGMVLGICGYPLPLISAMPWKFFDGKLFHNAYIHAKRNVPIQQLCESQEQVSQVYNLLSVVTYGSHLANHRLSSNRWN